MLELRSKIANEAQSEMSKEQREYYLRQQLRAIQKELGDENPEQAEIALLRERFAKADLPEDVRKEAERELARLERLPSAAPDYHVIRTYLDYRARAALENSDRRCSRYRHAPGRSWTRTTTTCAKSRNAFSSTWEF